VHCSTVGYEPAICTRDAFALTAHQMLSFQCASSFVVVVSPAVKPVTCQFGGGPNNNNNNNNNNNPSFFGFANNNNNNNNNNNRKWAVIRRRSFSGVSVTNLNATFPTFALALLQRAKINVVYNCRTHVLKLHSRLVLDKYRKASIRCAASERGRVARFALKVRLYARKLGEIFILFIDESQSSRPEHSNFTKQRRKGAACGDELTE